MHQRRSEIAAVPGEEWGQAYPLVPAEEDRTVDALAFTCSSAQLQALVEILHEGVFLVKANRFDGV